jgi:hypothetical protein
MGNILAIGQTGAMKTQLLNALSDDTPIGAVGKLTHFQNDQPVVEFPCNPEHQFDIVDLVRAIPCVFGDFDFDDDGSPEAVASQAALAELRALSAGMEPWACKTEKEVQAEADRQAWLLRLAHEQLAEQARQAEAKRQQEWREREEREAARRWAAARQQQEREEAEKKAREMEQIAEEARRRRSLTCGECGQKGLMEVERCRCCGLQVVPIAGLLGYNPFE